MRLLLIASALLVLMGCQPSTEDIRTYIAEVQQNTQVSIEPYPEFMPVPAFTYTAAERRSPFERPRNLPIEAVAQQQANCLQPNFDRPKQALERYGTDALSLLGVFTTGGSRYALLQANDGSLHKARKGDRLGLFFGQVMDVQDGTLLFTEMLPDGTGCWQRKEAKLTMASKAGETDNV